MTPTAKLDPRFSAEEAAAIDWEQARRRLEEAEVAWLVTVRRDGRPHTTPLVTVWHDGRLYFHTGTDEQKYVNLQTNEHVLILAGDTRWDAGLDVAVEGVARPLTDHDRLQAVADVYARRWDGRWRLEPGDGAFNHRDWNIRSIVFEVTPTRGFGHAKGDPFGQTTYRF